MALLWLIGLALSIGGYIWMVLAAFEVGLWWGIACLLFPPAWLFFLIFHFRDAIGPFGMLIIGRLLSWICLEPGGG